MPKTCEARGSGAELLVESEAADHVREPCARTCGGGVCDGRMTAGMTTCELARETGDGDDIPSRGDGGDDDDDDVASEYAKEEVPED